uniref:Uncharacterized protein n=1 Tax=Oryza brachyantha TaxID=4533 RepID=D4N3V5_ORYBR|nr:hypothetical protein [Oryza brachyantha]
MENSEFVCSCKFSLQTSKHRQHHRYTVPESRHRFAQTKPSENSEAIAAEGQATEDKIMDEISPGPLLSPNMPMKNIRQEVDAMLLT